MKRAVARRSRTGSHQRSHAKIVVAGPSGSQLVPVTWCPVGHAANDRHGTLKPGIRQDVDLTGGSGTGAHPVHLDDHGYLPCGLQVAGKRELADLLRWWLEKSSALTIGDIGSYGGRPCLRITASGHEVVLHADTKRAAVQAYLSASSGNSDRPPSRPWKPTSRTGSPPGTTTPGPSPGLRPPTRS